MPNSSLTINNRQARRLWLHLQGMLAAPHTVRSEHTVLDTVRQLGMVQLDSISTVARAHHHILWSRHSAYRQDEYNTLLGATPKVFEHFSHDAVILPMDLHPFWQRQHRRRSDIYKHGTLGKHVASAKVQKQIIARIEKEGPMCSRDFANIHKERADKSIHAWMRPPHKLALDYLWLKGDLCVSHRQGFIKYYDLASRLIPTDVLTTSYSEKEQIDFLCSAALQRLGFATANEIQRFYDACDLDEVKHWIKQNTSRVCEVMVETHEGAVLQRYAPASIATTLEALQEPCRRMRIICPFDPIVRDRTRLQQLFGMQYRIEIYTPAAKRQYGYYVYPVLEADKIVARVDLKANRKTDTLDVLAWWLEPGEQNSATRLKRLRSELNRLARLADVNNVSDVPQPSRHPKESRLASCASVRG
ncbi:MAG: winged helix-turn-helix domain-containing protein [Granulosicoccus sp.]